jgi:putative transposase
LALLISLQNPVRHPLCEVHSPAPAPKESARTNPPTLASFHSKSREEPAKLCAWVEDNIEETWTFYRLPREHHKHLKSTNMLERFNQELKRRTHVTRIFPNEASCLRLIRALAVEIHEDWIEAHRHLTMEALHDQGKADRQLPALAA